MQKYGKQSNNDQHGLLFVVPILQFRGIKKSAPEEADSLYRLTVLLAVSLSAHSLSNFDKATDVSTLNIVDLVTLFTVFNASIVDVFHDLGQFSVYFFSSPAISH